MYVYICGVFGGSDNLRKLQFLQGKYPSIFFIIFFLGGGAPVSFWP